MIIATLALVGLTAISARAATADGFSYTVDLNNNVTVTGCDGTCPSDLTIPDTLGGYSVTAIGKTAFKLKAISSVIIPDSVTTIGESAFESNPLSAITIGNSVTSIGKGAFAFNQVKSLVIPDSVTTIGMAAFIGGSLVSVQLSNSLTHINSGAFEFNFLKSVKIPASVVSIDEYAFGDNNFSSIIFDGNAPTAGREVFENSRLTHIQVRYGTTGWGSTWSNMQVDVGDATYTTRIDGSSNLTITGCFGTCPTTLDIPSKIAGNSVTAIGDSAFIASLATSATIPSSVVTIGANAFAFNLLPSITIPDSVTSIGDAAFYSNLLSSATFAGNAPTAGTGVFAGNNFEAIDVRFGSTGWGLWWSGMAVRIGPPLFTYTTDENNNVTVTGYDGKAPKDLVIPDVFDGNPVTAIGPNAFKEDGLTSVTIPATVTTISDGAFSTNNLTSVTIPAATTSLGSWAFAYNQLATVSIPNAVTEVGLGAFYGNNLATLTLGNSLATIGESAFSVNNLTTLRFPISVTSVGINAFSGNSLTSATFLGNAPSESAGVFGANENLKEITALYGTANWGSTWAGIKVTVIIPFTYTTDLQNNVTVTGCGGACPPELVIPETLGGNPVTTIGDQAFANVGLTSVTIPNSVTTISMNALRNNQLSALVIPSSVTSLGKNSFYGNQLTSVKFMGSKPTAGSGVFSFNPYLTGLRVAYGVTGWDPTFQNISVTVDEPPFTYTVDSDNKLTITGYDGACPTNLVIPETLAGNPVTSIASGVFGGKSITSLELPNNLISIGSGAFASNAITNIKIGNSVKNIYDNAFSNNKISNLNLPNTLINIGDGAFSNNLITDINLTNNLIYLGDSSFDNNFINSISIPDSIIYINNFTFRNNPLTYVNLPNTLITIGKSAFQYTNISSLTIPKSVTQIGESAFANSTLTSLEFLGNAPDLGNDAFNQNINLASVTVPSDATGFPSSLGGVSVSHTGSPLVTPTPTPNPVLGSYKSGMKITGTAKVNKTLTAKPGAWTGTAPITYSYQWYTCSKAVASSAKIGKLPTGCKVISGATKSTLKLALKQKKAYVAVLITASNSAGKVKVLSASVGAVK